MKLQIRGFDNQPPPEPRTRGQNNATLLFSWWCTIFALVIILLRIGGRLIRTERLFREDKIMALSIIPLLARMGLVHVILLYGTNNVDLRNVPVADYYHRSIGSRLVLASRIFYALFIWTAKFTVSEFLKRLTERFWRKGHELVLRGIRLFLIATFVAVVIATLGECQPFQHYWQISPDPGPRCRQGYAHLITMGATDIITDVLLVVFPIPLILGSAMPLTRKLNLCLLFALSIVLIAITAARVPLVIGRHGRQQYRTVWASAEILAAAAVSNAVVLGSFLRDRGIKKKKYRNTSTNDSMERNSNRRPTLNSFWGSDEDLIRSMGMRLDPELHCNQDRAPRPAPIAIPAPTMSGATHYPDEKWHYPTPSTTSTSQRSQDSELKSAMSQPKLPQTPRSPRRNVAFFDVGGLLESGRPPTSNSRSSSPAGSTSVKDFGPRHKTSFGLLQDLGGLLTPTTSRKQTKTVQEVDEPGSIAMVVRQTPSVRSPPTGVIGPILSRKTTDQSLQDVGGLLGGDRRYR